MASLIARSAARVLSKRAATVTPLSTTFARKWSQQLAPLQTARLFSTADKPNPRAMLSLETKVMAPPMVYIAGEEMTHYVCNLVLKDWFEPYFDTSQWQHFDLSCASRDKTNDQVLTDAVEAGKEIGAIYKVGLGTVLTLAPSWFSRPHCSRYSIGTDDYAHCTTTGRNGSDPGTGIPQWSYETRLERYYYLS
jgi:hypothetical protein